MILTVALRSVLSCVPSSALLLMSLCASSALAAPLEGTWVGVEESLGLEPSAHSTPPHAYVVTIHPGQFILTYDCETGRCTSNGRVVHLYFSTGIYSGLTQYVTEGYRPPGPRAQFVFDEKEPICARYGANAALGVWLEDGNSSIVEECFVPLSLHGLEPIAPVQPVNPPSQLPNTPQSPPYIPQPKFPFIPPGSIPPPPPKGQQY